MVSISMRTTFSGLVALFLFGVVGGCVVRAVDVPSIGAAAVVVPPDQIIAQAEKALHLAEAANNIPGQVLALNREGDALLLKREFDAAEKLRLRVVQLQEKHSGRNSGPVADALLSLGWFYSNLAHYEQAQSALDRCVEIRQRVFGPDSAEVAEVYNALGVLEENRSNFTLAEAFYLQSLAIREKVLGLQSKETATTWNNLAVLYWITGDYAQAEKYFTQALTVREKTLGPNSLAVASTLNNLAMLDSTLGDYDEAETYFQRALKIRQAKWGPDHPMTITTLSELGMLYVREGDDAKAEPLLVKAAEIRTKIYHPDHPDLARSLSQLGQLYDRRKLYAKAEPLLQQALDIRRKTLGVQHPEYASSLAYLARHYHAQGKLTEALPLYVEAQKIDLEALGRDHPETLGIGTDLTYLKIEMGQKQEAADLARKVVDAQEDVLNGVFTFAAERQRMDFARTIEPCDLPAALGDAELQAQTVLRTKGVVLDSLLEDEVIARAQNDPKVQELMEKQRLLSARLLQLQEDSSGTEASPAALEDRKKLEKEEQELEASLAGQGIGSGKMRRALSTEVAAIRSALLEGAALVEYVVYNRYKGHLASDSWYGAVVLTKKDPCLWVPLGPVAEIDARVKTCQKYMRRRVRDTTMAGVLSGLYGILCEPVITKLPPGLNRLIISPDGVLNFVSFATLLDGNNHFLAEDFDLNYVSSGRDLLRPTVPPPLKKRIIVFANPDYDNSSLAATAKSRGRKAETLFEPLPGTEQEAAFLEAQAKAEGWPIQVFRGSEATEANLDALDSPYILHLATHGLYLSVEEVAALPASSVGGESLKLSSQEPMTRSLLALAGGSVTLRSWKRGVFPSNEHDGLITAQKVASLNLNHTWLVVLSACDTGSGEAWAGEGVLGLRRGFTEAGVQNLLLTLWPIDDAETSELMQSFYKEALRTGDAPGALAGAQRASLKALRQKLGLSEAVRKAGPFILSY